MSFGLLEIEAVLVGCDSSAGDARPIFSGPTLDGETWEGGRDPGFGCGAGRPGTQGHGPARRNRQVGACGPGLVAGLTRSDGGQGTRGC